ncbi:unnamed protein product [Prorocentrum cordatum]|uniref:Uncharacterized protein n=1 Tax=Prorocentrum cordatum TaxID=2364126 RepID=A0ABN9T2M0_9DINO|nr:unnamed protein product [Polarella glacialis]
MLSDVHPPLLFFGGQKGGGHPQNADALGTCSGSAGDRADVGRLTAGSDACCGLGDHGHEGDWRVVGVPVPQLVEAAELGSACTGPCLGRPCSIACCRSSCASF